MGTAYGQMVIDSGGKTIAIGRDVRMSSGRILKSLSEAITRLGINILDIGIVPTPLLYFSLFNLPVDGGVMITASHNPPQDNGLKLAIGQETIHGPRIMEIRDRMEHQSPASISKPKGVIRPVPVRSSYIHEIRNRISPLPSFMGRPIHAVIDCGNGTGGLVARDLFNALGIKTAFLFEKPDGTFPNHHPDPSVPENLETLIAEVQRQKADIGIAFDGDSDRIGVVTGQGELLYGDQLMVLFSEQVLKRNPGAMIISEVKASKVLYDEIARMGGKPLMWKAGHSVIKAKMKEEGAPLAGEMSGHIFFKDGYFGFDDALYAGVRILQFMVEKQKTLSELLDKIPKTANTPELRMDCPDSLKFRLVDTLKSLLIKSGASFVDIDGVRVEYPDGWGLVRASNTQPALVLRFEGPTMERRDEIRNAIESMLQHAKQMMMKEDSSINSF
jgi:phosphomannomutase/phosphoglucomutase